ncbi:hypothetical protein MMG00_10220 [Ignatzschineria rhizosphaerae]|uniref:Uncharacterized protein n=1 Tax=Ignatzschineria rhizosphaerae TaxID=2923279 RepID=A0ABY3X128_9GAMM|nr:hypothetical protein [Ignatzschineria rhizosphaerae]UNM95590.1 hypothetical protein MMG00_10220 [Ignatzschineria rhizosphaerae]
MMRKFIIVSALVLSSSVAFAQFTGPTVERDSQPRRDNMGQWQDHPRMNSDKGQPNHVRNHQNMRHDNHRAEGPRHRQMNQQGYHRDGSRHQPQQYHHSGRNHGEYRKAHQHRGEMRQHSGHRQEMHQGSRSERRDHTPRHQRRHFNNR